MSLAALLGLAALLPAQVTHVDATLAVDGRVLSSRVEDIDGDGRAELAVASYDRAGDRRELAVYRFDAAGNLLGEPSARIAVLEDVVAWCWADVRPEPGKELVFLTRSGSWSYSLTHDGYRGNIARMVALELLFDVPDLRTLPHWDYVLSSPAGDRILLPVFGGYSIWGPTDERDERGAPVYALLSDFQAGVRRVQTTQGDGSRGKLSISADGLELDARLDQGGLVELRPPSVYGSLVETSNRVRAPALVDVDGDGLPELLRLGTDELHVHQGSAAGISPETTRSEPIPDYLKGSADRTFHLADLDGDGDADLLVQLEDKGKGLLETADVHRFLVLRNDGRMFPDAPNQLFKFEASRMRPSVSDVDGDGHVDLVFSRTRTGGLLDAASPTGFHLERDLLVYFGQGEARFERRPGLEHTDRFDAAHLDEGLSRRRMDMDCDGDGLADLVGVDLEGNVVIQRLEHESSFFGGESWSLSPTPWRRFAVRAAMRDTQVLDINGDGLGDVLSARDERLVLLLSRRVGAGR